MVVTSEALALVSWVLDPSECAAPLLAPKIDSRTARWNDINSHLRLKNQVMAINAEDHMLVCWGRCDERRLYNPWSVTIPHPRQRNRSGGASQQQPQLLSQYKVSPVKISPGHISVELSPALSPTSLAVLKGHFTLWTKTLYRTLIVLTTMFYAMRRKKMSSWNGHYSLLFLLFLRETALLLFHM